MKEFNVIQEYANKCLNCTTKTCSLKGCPLQNDIPSFIKAVKEKDYKNAYDILVETNVLQAICGRICPHQKQCEGSCVRGIKGESVNIGEIEAFVGDTAIQHGYKIPIKYLKKVNKKIAVIGGGPAGLSCSAYLAQRGYDVTIYDKHNYLGGLMAHGIPEFRLPKEVLNKTIENILNLGIDVKYNMELGRNISIDELEKEYDAIFIGIGANKSSKMNVEGEELDGVYGGNELLECSLHPNYRGKKVAVIGGGNVAIDCARTIKHLGAENIKIIYRRSEKQMPAEVKEIDSAKNEGIEFLFQNNIVKIIGENEISKNIENGKIERFEKIIDKVKKIELIKTELVKKEGETREVPINIENSNYIIDIDYVIMAIGSRPYKWLERSGLKLNKYGYIEIDENYRTSNAKIFAGGDAVGEKATVAWAAKSGIEAAKKILDFSQK